MKIEATYCTTEFPFFYCNGQHLGNNAPFFLPASLPAIPKQVSLQHRAKNYDHSIRTMFIFEIHVQYVYCLHLSTENMKSTHEIALGHLKCHFMFEPCLQCRQEIPCIINIITQHAIVLSNSYSSIMNKIFMNARLCLAKMFTST